MRLKTFEHSHFGDTLRNKVSGELSIWILNRAACVRFGSFTADEFGTIPTYPRDLT